MYFKVAIAKKVGNSPKSSLWHRNEPNVLEHTQRHLRDPSIFAQVATQSGLKFRLRVNWVTLAVVQGEGKFICLMRWVESKTSFGGFWGFFPFREEVKAAQKMKRGRNIQHGRKKLSQIKPVLFTLSATCSIII